MKQRAIFISTMLIAAALIVFGFITCTQTFGPSREYPNPETWAHPPQQPASTPSARP